MGMRALPIALFSVVFLFTLVPITRFAQIVFKAPALISTTGRIIFTI